MFEIALSCGLLVAAGLMVKSVAQLRNLDPGFTTKDVFTARVGFPAAYTDTIAQWRFFDEALQKVSAIPGVVSASVSSGLPATRQGFGGNNFARRGTELFEGQGLSQRALAVGDAGLLQHAQVAARSRTRLQRQRPRRRAPGGDRQP